MSAAKNIAISEADPNMARRQLEWKIWKPSEIYAELPAIEWLVEGVIPRGSIGLIAAYGASLKSWAELDLVHAIATGGKWLGRFQCKQGRALVIDYESGAYEIRRRLQRIARGRGAVMPVDGLGFVSMPPDGITKPAWLERVRELAKSHVLITIDTLSAASDGEDENDSRFAAPLNKLKTIAEETGCVFLVLHHTRKTKDSDDDREHTRGTGAIFAALDFQLTMFRIDNGDSFRCKQTKSRMGKATEPFIIRVDDVGPDASAVVAEDDQPDEHDGDFTAPIDRAKAKVLTLLSTNHDMRSGNEIIRRIKGTKKTNLEAIKELKERGLVKDHGGFLRLASEVA